MKVLKYLQKLLSANKGKSSKKSAGGTGGEEGSPNTVPVFARERQNLPEKVAKNMEKLIPPIVGKKHESPMPPMFVAYHPNSYVFHNSNVTSVDNDSNNEKQNEDEEIINKLLIPHRDNNHDHHDLHHQVGTKISKLSNGITVVTDSNPGVSTSVGIFTNIGSFKETPEVSGISHMLERLLGKSSLNFTADEIASHVENKGIVIANNIHREQSSSISVTTYDNLPFVMRLFGDIYKNPIFSDAEIEEQRHLIPFELELIEEEKDKSQYLIEQLHSLAYPNQSFGFPLIETCAENLHRFDQATVQRYWKKNLKGKNMVISATGVEHDEFVKYSESIFGTIPKNGSDNNDNNDKDDDNDKSSSKFCKPKYSGGISLIQKEIKPPTDPARLLEWKSDELKGPMTYVCLAFESANWLNPKEIFIANVLQTMLGGGNSFSAGGPGKGIYSRLYQDVLSQFHWCNHAKAFCLAYVNSGLFGITAGAAPNRAGSLLAVIIRVLQTTAIHVEEEELQRSKNQLKSLLMGNLENRQGVCEDMGRQMVMSGVCIDAISACKSIDAVTANDVKGFAMKLCKSQQPCVLATGDVTNVPDYESIVSYLNDISWYDPNQKNQTS